MIELNVSKNRFPYSGQNGRQRPYTAHSTVSLANVRDIIHDAMPTYMKNKGDIAYLWRYYKGDQPVLYRTKEVRPEINNKVVENHAYEIVEFKVAQTYGEPVQYISNTDDENISREVEMFNNFTRRAFKEARDVKKGRWQCATGTAFVAVQRNENNAVKPFRLVVLDPTETCVVYDKDTDEPILAFQELKSIDGEPYILAYSHNAYFKIVDDDVVESGLHVFRGIPIVEFPNNDTYLSDIEIVIQMLDAVNEVQSDRVDGIEQFIQSFMKFINCEIDKDTFTQMKQMGAIAVVSRSDSVGKADVEIMSEELNQDQTQIFKKDMLENVWSILGIPNKQENSGGDTAGAVELRNGWAFSKQRAVLKDFQVIESEKRLAEIMLNVIQQEAKACKNITVNDFEVQVSHSPTDNMLTKVQSLQLLLQSGVHPLVAVKVVGLFNDAEKTFLLSQPYFDELYKQAEKDGVNLAKEQERAQLFMTLVSAGFAPEIAAEKAGFDVNEINSSPSMSKWLYEPDNGSEDDDNDGGDDV